MWFVGSIDFEAGTSRRIARKVEVVVVTYGKSNGGVACLESDPEPLKLR